MAWDTDNSDSDRNSSINMTRKEKKKGCEVDPTAGATSNECRNYNLDMPFGFQDMDPMLITVIGEVVGNILSGDMPMNVANAFGNWLQLIAQVIVMFNAQQQYFQGGPGRYYNPAYRNISNPFTSEPGTSEGDGEGDKKRKKKRSSKDKRRSYSQSEIDNVIKQLDEEIELLKREIDQLKK